MDLTLYYNTSNTLQIKSIKGDVHSSNDRRTLSECNDK